MMNSSALGSGTLAPTTDISFGGNEDRYIEIEQAPRPASIGNAYGASLFLAGGDGNFNGSHSFGIGGDVTIEGGAGKSGGDLPAVGGDVEIVGGVGANGGAYGNVILAEEGGKVGIGPGEEPPGVNPPSVNGVPANILLDVSGDVRARYYFGSGKYLTDIASSNLADNSVDTAKIAADAVTNAKIINGAVTAPKMVNAGVFTGDVTGTFPNATLAVDRVRTTGDTMTGALNMNNVAINLTGANGNINSRSSVTASGFFGAFIGDGSGLVNVPTINNPTGVGAGTYGTATQVGQFTVNQYGQLTSATNVPITPPATSITAGNLASNVINTNAAGGDLSGNYPNPSLAPTIGTAHTWTGQQTFSNNTANFTQTGNSNFSVQTSSGINVQNNAGVYAGFFVGDGSHLTGVNASGVDTTKLPLTGGTLT
ncbi:MAG: hypothetical protein NTX64_07880, partial [Elusimicrobia bacterium]|nr:hypothetical protein [Elusimicrobiota bacterium]